MAEGVFLEWLAGKDEQKIEEAKVREAKAAEAKAEKCKVREGKWEKNVVVCCYSGAEALGVRKGQDGKVKSFRELGREASGGAPVRAGK